ncbi:MAG: capsule assembly Wzi family protein [Bacteroidia bacterium]
MPEHARNRLSLQLLHGRICIFLVLGWACLVAPLQSFAQKDSIWFSLESSAAFSAKEYLPHYLYSMSHGLLSVDPYILKPGAKWKHHFSEDLNFFTGLAVSDKFPLSKTYIHEGYGGVEWKFLRAWAGRKEQVQGLMNDTLTSGSLAKSGNTTPVPMIMIETPGFVEVPFTQDWLHFKAGFGHGWFGNDRYAKGTWLHEKSLHFMLKGNLPFSMYGGLRHYAMWGGTSPVLGELDNSFGDFLRVITASSGKSSVAGGESGNRLGNHLGVLEKGISFKLGEVRIKIYDQIPFEDHSGIKWFFNRDRLAGIDLSFQNNKIFKEIVYEFINTKYQSGPGTPDPLEHRSNYGHKYGGRDDYYNNYLYKGGWTYGNMVLGSPLITTINRMQQYQPQFSDALSGAIVNNRVSGHHLGILLQPKKYLSLMAKFTYTNNSGTYTGLNGGRFEWGSKKETFDHESYFFFKGKDQLYSQLKMQIKPKENYPLIFNIDVAADWGELSENWGLQAGVQVMLIERIKDTSQ